MALKIRLSRGGAKKRPFYRIVVADSRRARDGRFIERLGHFDPMLAKDHPQRVVMDQDRIKHWLACGATPSERVQGFLSGVGLAEKPGVPVQTRKHLPKAKAQERLKAAAEADAAAAGASAEAAPAEAAPAEAAPPEAAPAEAAPAEAAPAEGGEDAKAE
jgi:small subunit ribosomal protein S16